MTPRVDTPWLRRGLLPDAIKGTGPSPWTSATGYVPLEPHRAAGDPMASRSLVIPRQADSTQGRGRKRRPGECSPSSHEPRYAIAFARFHTHSSRSGPLRPVGHHDRYPNNERIENSEKTHLFFGNSAKYPETALFWSSIMEHTRLRSGASPRFSRWLKVLWPKEIASMYLRSALGFVAASVLSASLATTSYAQPSKSMPTAQGPSKSMPAYGAPQAPGKSMPAYGAPQAPAQVDAGLRRPAGPRASRRRATAPRRPPASRRRPTAPRRPPRKSDAELRLAAGPARSRRPGYGAPQAPAKSAPQA